MGKEVIVGLNLFRHFFRLFDDFVLKKRMRAGTCTWDQVKVLFERSDVVFTGPHSPKLRGKVQVEAINYLVENFPEAEIRFVDEICSARNPILVGYCLIGLQLLRSNEIFSLRPKMLVNDEVVTVTYGTQSMDTTIGDFIDGIIVGATTSMAEEG